ncbi:MAG: SIR2 family protein [Verrucomicrobia bacterium]|nr:SIR2 family protein [Verrucomicrobiota bacterium]
MNTKPPQFKDVRSIFTSESPQLALLIGNGINLAAGATEGISWDDLMSRLVNEAAERARDPTQALITLMRLLERTHGQRSASLPEVFDILEATGTMAADPTAPRIKQPDLQSRLADLLKDMKPGEPHAKLVNWAINAQVPILTTNYDHCLQDAIPNQACAQHRLKNGRAQSDYYPWDRYYSTHALTDPATSFAIWHVHGDRAMKRSIRAGLDQYMGMVERLRQLKRPVALEILTEPSAEPTSAPAYFKAPWLRVFMGRKLWIQGLALHADEVSLRWLLIQRFRYWKLYQPNPHGGPTGWYVHGPTEDSKVGALDAPRRAFFESVGLSVIQIRKKGDMYDKLFSPVGNARRATLVTPPPADSARCLPTQLTRP